MKVLKEMARQAAAGELASCGTRLAALAERQRALERELSDNAKKAEQLTASGSAWRSWRPTRSPSTG